MYKKNNGLSTKFKIRTFNKSQCKTERLVHKNPLLLLLLTAC